MVSITASVGLGGENRRGDVIVVQQLLKQADSPPGSIDGRCGRKTIHAIEQFQTHFLPTPDGRVDVDGPTLKHLQVRHGRPAPHAAGHTGAPFAGGGLVAPGRDHAAPPSANPPAHAIGGAKPQPPAPSPKPAAVSKPPQHASSPNDFWRGVTPLPAVSVNDGLVSPTSPQMMSILGDPHDDRAKSHMATEPVGPFRATGLKPALESLRAIFIQVHNDLPELYGVLGNNGMCVVRNTRGRTSYSNHSWGIAIDMLIGGHSPPLGAHNSIRGLDALLPYFHKAGWYWGGGYHNPNRKDPMHFECGLALVRSFSL